MAQLPDPTADLDWSGYIGPIQAHFSENAKKHPNRICVVGGEAKQTNSLYAQSLDELFKQLPTTY